MGATLSEVLKSARWIERSALDAVFAAQRH
jgi:hypothetical protein